MYTLAMFALAGFVALVPPLLGGGWRGWIYRGLVVLVVSCSCALVISVPVSVVAAISRAARDGVLVKGGVYLEALGKIRTVTFDKTGTLTRGRPQVTDVLALNGYRPDDVIRLAAGVEAASEQPLAEAILRAARDRGIGWEPGLDLRVIPGVGVEATVDGRRLFVGKPDGTGGDPSEISERFARLEDEGKTAVVLAEGTKRVGIVAIADELRDEVPGVVASLHQLGIRNVVMLTGDNQRVAEAIATHAGIDDWQADLLPEDKTEAVRTLQRAYGPIANGGRRHQRRTCPSWSRRGSRHGRRWHGRGPRDRRCCPHGRRPHTKLPSAVRLARRAQTNIRQNIAMSLATVVFLIIAALVGWLSLTSGPLLNEATALLIIGNGLRLIRLVRQTA